MSTFQFGTTTVEIYKGDILNPPVQVEAVASSDDNYLTMGAGVSRSLANRAGSAYIQEAHRQCPVEAGTVVVTGPGDLPNVKYVLHGAVIDYDTGNLTIEQLVYEVTTNCLREAEKRSIAGLVLPAFATGRGGQMEFWSCARQMCTAIKVFLAQPRRLKSIYIVLFLPPKTDPTYKMQQKYNEEYITEAERILGTPHDAALYGLEARDFGGREEEIRRIEAAVESGRRVMILGGPSTGKTALLEQLFCRANPPPAPAGAPAAVPLFPGWRVAKASFGRLHKNTPKPFIYRKFLLGLEAIEEEAQKEELRKGFDGDDPEKSLKEFLTAQAGRNLPFLFLVDEPAWKIRQDSAGAAAEKASQEATEEELMFWQVLDDVEKAGARFIIAVNGQRRYRDMRDKVSASSTDAPKAVEEATGACFDDEIESVWLSCLTEEERTRWVNTLFTNYLGRPADDKEHFFVSTEAGRHPYLIALASSALIGRLKAANQSTKARELARQDIERPRREFFEALLGRLNDDEKDTLERLASAVDQETKLGKLIGSLDKEKDARDKYQVLSRQRDPRRDLHMKWLAWLGQCGYLTYTAEPTMAKETAQKSAQLMADSFAEWLRSYFGLLDRREDQPRDVIIGFLQPQPDVVTTLFGRRGAHLVSAQKRLTASLKTRFLTSFRECVNYRLSARRGAPKARRDLEQVAHFILTYFTTEAIKRYLDNPPDDATILLTIDEALQHIPWELMLEAAYAGEELPFIVGRSIVGPEAAHNLRPPVRGGAKVRTLLIGNPTDDLSASCEEIEELRKMLLGDGRFEIKDEDVLLGSKQCQWMPLLERLSSGDYGLIHYSGHSGFDGEDSGWSLKKGRITTDLLTSALQKAPPVLVFSSSCESATTGKPRPAIYENQTYDLPSAFLRAGVEAYVGTLWSIDSGWARMFVEKFYESLLKGSYTLGQCLREAKRVIPLKTNQMDRLAFILYGDPDAMPDQLFRAMQKKECEGEPGRGVTPTPSLATTKVRAG